MGIKGLYPWRDMDITIYLPDDLGKWAKEHELPLSRMLREAVEAEQSRQLAIQNTLEEAGTTELEVEDDDGDSYTARIHGTLIAEQGGGSYPGVYVYLGKDENVYVYEESSGKLYRDVAHSDLRDWLPDDAAYSDSMRALGEDVIIDIGLPE
jgi:hypothetical protein